MTNTNDAPMGTLDRIAFEASKAERARDSRTHGVLHTVEMKLHELNYACREALKVVTSEDQLRLELLRMRALFLEKPGTPEYAQAGDEFVALGLKLYPPRTAPAVDTVA